MRKLILLTVVVALFLASCSNEKTTPSGVKFTVIKKGDGIKVDSGKFWIVNFQFKDGKDSTWYESKKGGNPEIIQMQGSATQKEDVVMDVLKMLTKGDSATFKVSAKVLFAKTFHQPIPPGVDSLSNFTFNLGIRDVMDLTQVRVFQTELVAKQNAKIEKEQKIQLGKDTVLIDQYLKEKNLVANKTASGLRYIVIKEGTGKNAVDGQVASVNYSGYLLNGTYFDSSVESIAKEKSVFQPGRKYGPYDTKVGAGQAVKGWEEALKLMNKGSKLQAYVPSTLGFGAQRRSKELAENSILIFDLEMVNISDK